MKILFIAPANSIHTVRWVNALSQKGNKVFLISLANHGEGVDKINEAIEVIYLPIKGFKGYYLNALYLKIISMKIHPNIINVHYASGYGTLARMAKLPNVILSVWGSDVYDFPYESKLKMRIIKKNILWASRIASTSYIMAEQVEKIMGKKMDIKVTPFGVDCKKFAARCEKSKEEFCFGTIKALLPKYGIDTIIIAFAIFYNKVIRLNAGIKKISLEIYGQGEKKDELKELSHNWGMDEYINFHDYIEHDKVPDIINNIDIFCCGSRYDSESFGVSAVEAMACEVPVIVTNVDGFKEVVKHGITGYITNRENPSEMADYMLKLYQNEKLRKKMGRNGRERVVKLYKWEENVNTMIQLYNEMIV